MKPPKPSTRLYVLLARKSSLAVVFRRGPSKQVLQLTWDTATDQLWRGQWFKGRIYERRCDLSPSGEKLIYLAASQKPPLYSWTAVSRPPYFTALALWPKGDTYGGGGLFGDERTIQLNHAPYHRKLADGFAIPKSMTVGAMSGCPGGGEDDPIWSTRLARDGWVLRQAGRAYENKRGSKIWWSYREPVIWTKSHRLWTLQMRILGLHATGGPWWVTDHRIFDDAGNVALDLDHSDWADWSSSGDVLFAREGRLYRIPIGARTSLPDPVEVADLRELRFEECPAPDEALVWSGRGPRGRLIEENAGFQAKLPPLTSPS